MAIQVLMLAWGFPPNVTGGLDTAVGELFEHLETRDEVDIELVLPAEYAPEGYDNIHGVPTGQGDIITRIGRLSGEFVEQSNARRREQCKAAIGTEDDDLAEAYDFQLEHICHDVNALRNLLGEVDSIAHVDFLRDGYFGTAHLVYEGGERVLLQSGDSERHFHEQFVRVDTPARVLRLEFDHPFVRYNGATLSIRSGKAETADCRYSPTREESFKRELEHFVACVRGEETVRTPVAEARDDSDVITGLFELYTR